MEIINSFPDFNVHNFPIMPKAKVQSTCGTCTELGFDKLEIAHALETCMRCVKCHIWRTCGQKKHDKSCSGKPPAVEIIVIKGSGKVEANGERIVGRDESDQDFVEDCRHFHGGRGHCDRGEICNFAHDIIGKSAKEVSGAKGRWVENCKFVNSRNGCDKGDTCPFSHDNNGISAKEASGNIECFKCGGGHHIRNCTESCGECGSNTHITEKCIQCNNCNEWGHHSKVCQGPCGYCNEVGHKQWRCWSKANDESFCKDCKVNGHTKESHCRLCDSAPTKTGTKFDKCPCRDHMSSRKPTFTLSGRK